MNHRKLVSAVLGATVVTLAFSVTTAEASAATPVVRVCAAGQTLEGDLCEYNTSIKCGLMSPHFIPLDYLKCIGSVPTPVPSPTVVAHHATNKVATHVAVLPSTWTFHHPISFWSY